MEIWDLRTHQPLAVYNGHRGSVTTIAFNSCGDRIASESSDAHLKVWEAHTGKEIRSLKGTAFVHLGSRLQPGREHLLSSCAETSVKIWDLETGT